MSIETFAADDAKLIAGKHFFLPCNEGSGDILVEKASGAKYTISGLAWNGKTPDFSSTTEGPVAPVGGTPLPDLNTVDWVFAVVGQSSVYTFHTLQNGIAKIGGVAVVAAYNDAGGSVIPSALGTLNVAFKVVFTSSNGAVSTYNAAAGTALAAGATATLSTALNLAVPQVEVNPGISAFYGVVLLTYPKGSLPANASSLVDAMLENWVIGNRVIPSALVNV